MTAAHCTEYMDAGELIVVVGEHDLSVHDDNGRSVAVRAIHEHPHYDDGSFGYDFAILELVEELNFSSNVRPACLPTEEAPYIGVRGTFLESFISPFKSCNVDDPFYDFIPCQRWSLDGGTCNREDVPRTDCRRSPSLSSPTMSATSTTPMNGV